MTPAPYNRAALQRIREQRASAIELGWSETHYRRVCRDHGLEPHASAVPSDPGARPAVPFAHVRISEETGILKVADQEVMLPTPAAIAIFATLLHRRRRGVTKPMVGSAFRSLTQRPWSRAYISRSVIELNKAIAPLGLTVSSKTSGYWLAEIDADTSQETSVSQ